MNNFSVKKLLITNYTPIKNHSRKTSKIDPIIEIKTKIETKINIEYKIETDRKISQLYLLIGFLRF